MIAATSPHSQAGYVQFIENGLVSNPDRDNENAYRREPKYIYEDILCQEEINNLCQQVRGCCRDQPGPAAPIDILEG